MQAEAGADSLTMAAATQYIPCCIKTAWLRTVGCKLMQALCCSGTVHDACRACLLHQKLAMSLLLPSCRRVIQYSYGPSSWWTPALIAPFILCPHVWAGAVLLSETEQAAHQFAVRLGLWTSLAVPEGVHQGP